MCFSAAPSSEKIPWQHELGLEYRAGGLDPPVQCRCHPAVHRVKHLSLYICDRLAGVHFVPAMVQSLGRGAQLHYQIGREVFRLHFAAFFLPQPEQGGLVIAHDDSGVRAADKAAPCS